MTFIKKISALSLILIISLPIHAFDLEAIEASREGQISTIRDSRTGLVQNQHLLQNDNNRMRFNAQLFPNPKKANEVFGLSGRYAHRVSDYLWAEGGLSYYRADTVRITDIPHQMEVNGKKMAESQSSLLGLNLGVALRGNLAQNFLGNNWFESLSAALTYTSMSEPTLDETFQGLGLQVDFSLHNRLGTSYFWGLNAQYSLSQLKRAEAFEGESSSARILTTYWYSLGVELGFYF